MNNGTTPFGGAEQQQRYELTAVAKAGIWLVLLALAGILAYDFRPQLRAFADPSRLVPPTATAAVTPVTEKQPFQPVSSPSIVQVEPKQQVSAKAERSVQMNNALQVAWKAAFDEQGRRLADAEKALQDLDALIAAIPKNVSVKPKEEAVGVSHVVRKNLEAAKAIRVDISALPIEFVTAEKSGISAFGKGAVSIGGESIRIGSKLPSGEVLVAVDPESRTVVTDKRIVTVTN